MGDTRIEMKLGVGFQIEIDGLQLIVPFGRDNGFGARKEKDREKEKQQYLIIFFHFFTSGRHYIVFDMFFQILVTTLH